VLYVRLFLRTSNETSDVQQDAEMQQYNIMSVLVTNLNILKAVKKKLKNSNLAYQSWSTFVISWHDKKEVSWLPAYHTDETGSETDRRMRILSLCEC
jgi:hypothetical protein